MSDAAEVVALLIERRLTVAVAESLTGGLLIAELVSVPGASAVVRGGVTAYATPLKDTLLGVSSALLAQFGPVHRDVAAQMAVGVRTLLTVDGVPADIGLSTTGVAGPGPADGHPAGTVFIGSAWAEDVRVLRLCLDGDREHIRRAVVSESLSALKVRLLEG